MRKQKKCKNCKKEFEPTKPFQQVCSYICAITLSKEKLKVKTERKQRKETKEKLLNLEPKSFWEAKLQTEINKLIRLIDFQHLCISCGGKPIKGQAGHFRSVGSCPALRFDLRNIWLQCHKCNAEMGGNVHGYDNGLIELFGRDVWEQLKFNNPDPLRLTIDELKEIIKEVREIIRGYEVVKLSHRDRLSIREVYNSLICKC